jgi:hypothetical protein
MLGLRCSRFTLTSIAAVIASLILAQAAFYHGLQRGLRESIREALSFGLGRTAPQPIDHTEFLLVSVAILLAAAGLISVIIAIRSKEPVLRFLPFAAMLLSVVCFWSWIAEWGLRILAL